MERPTERNGQRWEHQRNRKRQVPERSTSERSSGTRCGTGPSGKGQRAKGKGQRAEGIGDRARSRRRRLQGKVVNARCPVDRSSSRPFPFTVRFYVPCSTFCVPFCVQRSTLRRSVLSSLFFALCSSVLTPSLSYRTSRVARAVRDQPGARPARSEPSAGSRAACSESAACAASSGRSRTAQ